MSFIRFLNISKKLYNLAPWDYLGNYDYCQMFLEDEQPLLVCITGSAVTQNFGFIICTNPIQADYFLSLRDEIEESEISSYRRYQHYSLFYKKYQDLNEEEKKIFKDKPQEELYPVLKHICWHNPDTSVSESELESLCSILENLYMLINAVAFGKIKKTNQDFYEVPTRIYNPNTKEYDNLYFAFLEDMYRISPTSVLNQEKIQTGFSGLIVNDLIVEYDLLYLPLKQAEDSLLALVVLWDVEGKKKLSAKLLDIKDGRESAFMNFYLSYIMEFGFFKEVRCRDNIDKKLLASLDIPKKPNLVVSKLENIDRIVEEIMDQYY